jgi:hypothetical protein
MVRGHKFLLEGEREKDRLKTSVARIIAMGREACDYLDHAAGLFTAHSPATCHICKARLDMVEVPPK